MDFRDGGRWLYYMQAPDGSRHYCRADYTNIVHNKSFMGDDAVCDENGNINKEFPRMSWKTAFSSTGTGTTVEVEITFASEADMEKTLEMGFKEGFAATHGNLDELLAK
jgi:uncharacterized protein YndB with AHSA1/START domain